MTISLFKIEKKSLKMLGPLHPMVNPSFPMNMANLWALAGSQFIGFFEKIPPDVLITGVLAKQDLVLAGLRRCRVAKLLRSVYHLVQSRIGSTCFSMPCLSFLHLYAGS